MLLVHGLPIIAYSLRMLADAGFADVTINLHHLPEVVRDYVRDGSAFGLRVTYSDEPVLLGTAGALVPVAQRFRTGTFAVVFGDNVIDLDLTAMLARHRARGALATVAVCRRSDVSQSGVAELSAEDRIMRFIEKPRAGETDSHWVNAGVVVCEPPVLDLIPRDRPSDLGRDVLPELATRGRAFAFRMGGRLWWFDRTEDYAGALADDALAAFAKRRS